MLGLSMETKMLILAKHVIYRCEASLFYCFSFGSWINVLGHWFENAYCKSATDLNNAMGSMYTACLFLRLQNSAAGQPVVDVERTVFYREKAAGMYSALSYALAQILVEIPYILAQSTLYCLIVYAMIGFDWTVAKLCWNFFFTFCTLLYFAYFGMMTVAVTPNADVAAVIAAAFYILWNLFSGFIVPRPSMPKWWKWWLLGLVMV